MHRQTKHKKTFLVQDCFFGSFLQLYALYSICFVNKINYIWKSYVFNILIIIIINIVYVSQYIIQFLCHFPMYLKFSYILYSFFRLFMCISLIIWYQPFNISSACVHTMYKQCNCRGVSAVWLQKRAACLYSASILYPVYTVQTKTLPLTVMSFTFYLLSYI